MSTRKPYSSQSIFVGDETDPNMIPRVLITPHRYIQGKGVLDHLGRYISILPGKHPLVLISAGGNKRFGERVRQSLKKAQAKTMTEIFQGECCVEEIDRICGVIKEAQNLIDAVITVGGGKCLDTGKCVAFRLNVPVITCPTIASTDAPCSAVSVMYSPDGVQIGVESFPNSPAIVVVDTRIISESPPRYLVAGMGDALATAYEARTCFDNIHARSIVGARPTITALTIAELCAKTIFQHGEEALAAVKRKEVNEAVERVVEANTLLSGVGFESGGLAAAHAMATGLTVIPELHNDYMHGELVGIGLVTQLILEGNKAEARRVCEFMAKVGLPVHMEQLGLDADKDAEGLKEAMAVAAGTPLAASEPFEVTQEKLSAAFEEAHQMGLEVAQGTGDSAYRELHEIHTP